MTKIADIRHPCYSKNIKNWEKFRLVMTGGSDFINAYLQKYSQFEEALDFTYRRSITYNPGTAASAITTIRNSIYQRLTDVVRRGGDKTYQEALSTGVDVENKNMATFIGTKVLPELLALGKVLISVDAPPIDPDSSLLDTAEYHPYLNVFQAEDVLSWKTDLNGDLETLLVRNRKEVTDPATGLTSDLQEQYLLYTKFAGKVVIEPFNKDSEPGKITVLDIPEIPFICLELEHSLLKDVADFQIAALQLASSDVNSLFRNNFPLYTEQYDPKFQNRNREAHPGSVGTSLEAADSIEARATRALQGIPPADEGKPTIFAGAGKGRSYPTGSERPGFISPQSEPVKASMLKQEQMAKEVKELVHLALSSLASSYASGTSKQMDQAGLEAGLSYIGMLLEHAENEIARIWQMYIGSGTPANVTYPKTYSLKTEQDRLDESKKYLELQGATPSATYSKNVSKKIAHSLLGGVIDQAGLDKIYSEIDKAPGITGDPTIIASDTEWGLVSRETACKLRGYPEGEADKAKKDFEDRVAATSAAQTAPGGDKGTNDPTQMKDQKKVQKTNDPTAVRGQGK
jgi:hypothetical protein